MTISTAAVGSTKEFLLLSSVFFCAFNAPLEWLAICPSLPKMRYDSVLSAAEYEAPQVGRAENGFAPTPRMYCPNRLASLHADGTLGRWLVRSFLARTILSSRMAFIYHVVWK